MIITSTRPQPAAQAVPTPEPQRKRTRAERSKMVEKAVAEYGRKVPPWKKTALARQYSVNPVTIRRAIREQFEPEPAPRAFIPSTEVLLKLAIHHGKIKDAYREMRAEQEAGTHDYGLKSYPTLCRALSAEPWLIPALKAGPEALDPFLRVGIYEAPWLNALSSGDATKIPWRCLNGSQVIEDLWLFAIGEDYSRAITAHAVCIGELTGELSASVYLAACLGRELSVEQLWAHGIYSSEPVLFGGVPDMLVLDNAQANLSEPLADATLLAGSTLHFARPHVAADKGKLERYFDTFKNKLAAVPGWTAGAQSHPADGHESRPYAVPADADLPKVEAVVATVNAIIDDYNWNHVVSTTGQTPIARWVEGQSK